MDTMGAAADGPSSRVGDMPASCASRAATGPVTVIVSRQVKPGREADYEAWLQGVTRAAHQFPGYLGADVIRPGPAGPREYTTIFRFSSLATLEQWEAFAVRREWMARVAELISAEATVRRLEGLEFWFTGPGIPTAVQPSPHKMAVILIVVVFCMLSTLGPLIRSLLGGVPGLLRTLIVVTIQVVLMTYLVMPRVTRALAFWLYPKVPSARRAT